jgi:glucose/arabinose dehydrogenase
MQVAGARVLAFKEPAMPIARRLIVLPLAAAATSVFGQQQEEKQHAAVHRHVLQQGFAMPALQVPGGFRVDVFADDLEHPRMMDVDEEGTVYITRRDRGDVVALRDTDGDGRADDRRKFVTGLPGVHGVAVQGDQVYLASSTTIWRMPRAGGAPQPVVTGLPEGGQHANRMVRFGPDGLMYITIGSSCNDCAEENLLERGTMIRYTPDGQKREVVANGLRNTIGYDWHAATGELWGMDNGNDFHGDWLPPEELNRIVPGRNYGWPICHGDRHVDAMTNAPPERVALEPGRHRPLGKPMPRDEYCGRTEGSVLTAPAHAAPIALRFATASGFPAQMRGDAFVAFRGSWNRREPVGYKVQRILFDEAGRPRGFEDFLVGFVDPATRQVLGRPAGIAFAADGAMLVSDDLNGIIYRVAWMGSATSRAPRR